MAEGAADVGVVDAGRGPGEAAGAPPQPPWVNRSGSRACGWNMCGGLRQQPRGAIFWWASDNTLGYEEVVRVCGLQAVVVVCEGDCWQRRVYCMGRVFVAVGWCVSCVCGSEILLVMPAPCTIASVLRCPVCKQCGVEMRSVRGGWASALVTGSACIEHADGRPTGSGLARCWRRFRLLCWAC